MLRPVSSDALPQLRELAVRIWWEHYPSIISDEQITYMLERGYSLEALQQQQRDGQQFLFIEVDDQPVGYIGISVPKSGEAFIHKFYLESTVRGKGVGSAAFNELLARFPDVHTYRLQVNRRNYKSINFYFKLGFTIEEVFDMPIGQGFSMDDFMMVRVD